MSRPEISGSPGCMFGNSSYGDSELSEPYVDAGDVELCGLGELRMQLLESVGIENQVGRRSGLGCGNEERTKQDAKRDARANSASWADGHICLRVPLPVRDR